MTDSEENPRVEFCTFKRLKRPVALTVRLLGTPRHHEPITIETSHVSSEGLLLELKMVIKKGAFLVQDSNGNEVINLVPFLILNQKMVELDIKLPTCDEDLKAIGNIVGFDFGTKGASNFFKAGILLEEMAAEDRKHWETFVSTVAEQQDKDFRVAAPQVRLWVV